MPTRTFQLIKMPKDFCHKIPNFCGKEAICHTFPNDTSKCLCPHDLSKPTMDLTCSNPLYGNATLSFIKSFATIGLNQTGLSREQIYSGSEIRGCKDNPNICGKEAMCHIFADNTSMCMCIYNGLPIPYFRCPNRLIGKGPHESDTPIVQLDSGSEIKGCKDNPDICGKEAACRFFADNTSTCVCPRDLSPPTPGLTCPNRVIVYPTPDPNITYNLIFPNGTNSTYPARRYTIPELEQVVVPKHKIVESIGVASALVVALIIGIVLLLNNIRRERRRNYNIRLQRSPLDEDANKSEEWTLLAHKHTLNPQNFTSIFPDIPIIQRESLTFLHAMGEGCFGKVYKGKWRNGDSKEIVAIKILKDNATPETEQDFMREVDTVSTFNHANILSLKGMVLRDATNNPWMVFEYMPYGDLAEVLRANSTQIRTSKSELQPLTEDSLCWISIQIAAGMTYLSAQRFVHRDLACRNCLVGSSLTVKIADFGMSRDIYTCDYYKIGGSRPLPVRWMSPESVVYGRFTLETDVWSFGVVLWEIYTFGKQPYYGLSNEEVVKLILQGTVLVPPDECPPIVCQIMHDCWKIEPRERIKFPDILERLEKAQNELTRQGTLFRLPQDSMLQRTSDVLDPDDLVPAIPARPNFHEYLQTLPDLSD